MSKQQEEFDYYCLDRLQPLTEELVITYTDGSAIRKKLYKIGLRANIKHVDCFVLYTESEEDLEEFKFISTEIFYNNQKRLFTDIITATEFKELIKKIPTINIFEFTSLLQFNNIYQDFKDFVEYNWMNLNMDDLIEL